MKKFLIIILFGIVCFLYFPQVSKPSSSLKAVFRLTEQPAVIVKGTHGSALTVNISFGEREIEELLDQLEKPYPLFFVDTEWADRFPDLSEKIKKRALPVALLGRQGADYEEDPALLTEQLNRFEELFDARPLWFRTADEQFPSLLLQELNKEEVNALGSTIQWNGGSLPATSDGDIIAVSFHRKEQITLPDFQRLASSQPFESIEDLLFKPVIKTKKFPQ